MAPPHEGHRQRALGWLLCLWLIVSAVAVGDALLSDWPPVPELPTAEQVREARDDVWAAAVVSGVLLLFTDSPVRPG